MGNYPGVGTCPVHYGIYLQNYIRQDIRPAILVRESGTQLITYSLDTITRYLIYFQVSENLHRGPKLPHSETWKSINSCTCTCMWQTTTHMKINGEILADGTDLTHAGNKCVDNLPPPLPVGPAPWCSHLIHHRDRTGSGAEHHPGQAG